MPQRLPAEKSAPCSSGVSMLLRHQCRAPRRPLLPEVRPPSPFPFACPHSSAKSPHARPSETGNRFDRTRFFCCHPPWINQRNGEPCYVAARLFLADQSKHMKRSLSGLGGPAFLLLLGAPLATAQTITTGVGTGDGSPAAAATLNLPYRVATDAAGNLFIAERAGHRIRRVDAATGDITTVAGDGTPENTGDTGPGVAAQLDSPCSSRSASNWKPEKSTSTWKTKTHPQFDVQSIYAK